jgi:hypothetical protein
MGQLMWGGVLPSDSTQNAMEVSVLQSRRWGSYRQISEGVTGDAIEI